MIDPSAVVSRQALVAAARQLDRDRLNHGATGNVSGRLENGFLITPSAVPAADLTPEHIVELDRDGAPRAGRWAPSSEWRLHRDLYLARPDMVAVVHAHPPHATAMACLRQPIPALHYMVALGGGDHVPVADYATFGTAALSDNACAALATHDACLLANHGLLATGTSLDRALGLAVEVEALAEVFLLARGAGEPVILDAAEMARVHRRFADYGRPRTASDRGSED